MLTIESLIYCTRALAFFVPSAVGVQEGGYIMIGAALGLAPDLALSLSLLKRGRDLLIGVPALVSWQLLEFRAHRAAASGGSRFAGNLAVDRREQ